jgi:hypothetical protein
MERRAGLQGHYRVYFWQQLGDRPDAGWASEEWQLEDAKLREVLRWADNDETHCPWTDWPAAAARTSRST